MRQLNIEGRILAVVGSVVEAAWPLGTANDLIKLGKLWLGGMASEVLRRGHVI